MAKEKGIAKPTKAWFQYFKKRHPELVVRQPKKRDRAREVVSEEIVDNYFKDLETALKEANLFNMPANIWNIDETGVCLDHTPSKVLCHRHQQTYSITAGKSPITTLIACVSAIGDKVPPYIIFKGERCTENMRRGAAEGTVFKSSTTGWSNSHLFLDFFNNHFLKVITTRPLFVLYDGHSSHVGLDLIETARADNVHLFVLPPHSSHILQPLDVSVFGPFKKTLSALFQNFIHKNPSLSIVLEDLPFFISKAFQSAMTVPVIMAGFRKTGIFPFCPVSPAPACPTLQAAEDRRHQLQG